MYERKSPLGVLKFILLIGYLCSPVLIAVRDQENSVHPRGTVTQRGVDDDGDGLDDTEEAALAEAYAPIIVHANDEPNLPTNVDWFLAKTELWVMDVGCDQRRQVDSVLTQHDLLVTANVCGKEMNSTSDCDREKQSTFFLKDVDDTWRRGSEDASQWTTYFHAYPNKLGGVTLQYWRFYAYNTGVRVNLPLVRKEVEVGFHGGDWEGLHVVLSAARKPASIRLLGHVEINEHAWESIQHSGDHPVVFVEPGGHATLPSGGNSGIRQETWTGGKTRWPDDRVVDSGRLVNLGSRRRPMNGQVFIRYSGLWGSPSGITDIIGRVPARFREGIVASMRRASSGYWGPAFNETAARPDGFVTAWCVDEVTPVKEECVAQQSRD